MRTETVKRNYGTYDELSEKAQAKALEKYRDINTSHDWWAYSEEEFHRHLSCSALLM